ncbi:MAG: DUF2281 domain-containing protein [Gammaproteobacteria bacterium]|nr:DUF2281 domain-containing protein [Gammaproteobacteria bacterium]
MSFAEAIYERCRRLPDFAAREALDFIEFLEQRYAAAQSPATTDEERRRLALAHLATVRIHWGGKPIPDRNALYDEARG